jgi:uncharacterized protein (DUF58 family)
MLIAGLNYANSVALFLTFLLGGFAIVAMHRCHRNLLGIGITDATAQPAFAGESARLRITFENRTALARGAIDCALPGSTPVRAELAAGARSTVELAIPAPRRGVLSVDRLKVMTSFPFGLFQAWTWVHAPIATVVYPRPRGLQAPPAAPYGRAGVRANTGSGDDEWLGLRPFRDGDSPRRIAWKAVARGATLVVKDYGAAADDLRLFDFASVATPGTEARLEQLARWIVDAEGRGDRYGLRLPGIALDAGRGFEHRHRCLRELAVHGIHPEARRGL